ncbi:cell division protein FtsZ [Parasediminibacterium sp. JCM 36343]|uniref:cell division protein FtsZ n=1 Tax=Parasediminibacterium sp. JCM 36343 TaxID=3374279 RepID=UPI003978CBB4
MIHFDLPKQKSSIIKVIGVGGGGSNAVNFMFGQEVEGVDFIVCNTDAKALEQSKVPNKIQLGPYLTQGLGAGANPEVGKKATEESLEEIKKILEVNTKMAFITVGMGGGTGTGGAPIIAQICKGLGILTVGIVTTPFGFEGPRRLALAEEGINQLKPHVDTLLVISNDKLRMQYGNLKMREAFGKADNVLATAAKCITDIINSRGHIIVDFADVCTVMKNGGVAILGKAEAEGENRAQEAIEEALASPLLNDNDIKGAKWILININCAEGEDECTMDEIETINNHLRMQAGKDTNVILGMGYDNTLEKKIGITMIATGFDSKDPFEKPMEESKPNLEPEKIVMTLKVKGAEEAPAPNVHVSLPVVEKDPMAPTLQTGSGSAFTPFTSHYTDNAPTPPENLGQPALQNQPVFLELNTAISNPAVQQPAKEEKIQPIKKVDETLQFIFSEKPATANGISSKPANIYAPPVQPQQQVPLVANNAATDNVPPAVENKIDITPVLEVAAKQQVPPSPSNFEDLDMNPEAEEQRRKLQERIHRLRNLNYNVNDTDNNNDFENVPAYIRKKMDMFDNTFNTPENYYSKYTVNKDDNSNRTEISSLNTFLEGKKPD